MAETTARPITDARFLAVLAAVADQVVDQTGTSRNGEVWLDQYRGEVSPWDDPSVEIIPPAVWIAEQVDNALREPATNGDQIRAMLAARARLGENIHLIEDIDREAIRAHFRSQDQYGDALAALLDFVDEVHKIAKDI